MRDDPKRHRPGDTRQKRRPAAWGESWAARPAIWSICRRYRLSDVDAQHAGQYRMAAPVDQLDNLR